ncbi:hypothetical protein SAMN05216198_2465 [Halopseudomonas litoralis]|uniref:Uncharacterized protein n=1 Tax=Halopseudomonas litoralis TaxID=797277 RepID=A0A1H1U1Y2_9GAMM|nr:hypothetical protein [Halopseudomonas litoralis]SDS66374.1 hypothetical protein SAMN05216198_2465 [Halopseudomonas litoralis]
MDASETRDRSNRRLSVFSIIIVFSATMSISLPSHASDRSVERQTVFSDHNYTPRRSVNSMRSVMAEKERDGPVKAPKIERKTEKVKWLDARGTETEYRMYYQHDGITLDFASVCSNHRSGSITYRNCRKAARQWFGTKCNGGSSAGKMYCHARNAFRP